MVNFDVNCAISIYFINYLNINLFCEFILCLFIFMKLREDSTAVRFILEKYFLVKIMYFIGRKI